ncbi:hypothetical protein [Actinomadura sp. 3N407]|uniref:hypothetical protein n=1 Tax=Actinomadura sp. 3N407 TaxID=3457423 RepID=UPI003FCD5664
MKTAVKATLLTLHTAMSLLVALLIAQGFVMVPTMDGSNANPTGLASGLLTLVACCLPAVPLVVAAAMNGISRWWVVAHAVLTLAAIVLIVYAVNYEEVAPTGP